MSCSRKQISQNALATAEFPQRVSQLISSRLKLPNSIMLQDGGNWDKWLERDWICNRVGLGGKYTTHIIVVCESSTLTLSISMLVGEQRILLITLS